MQNTKQSAHASDSVRATDIASEYVAVIRFTRAHPEIPAILEATGQTFDEVCAVSGRPIPFRLEGA